MFRILKELSLAFRQRDEPRYEDLRQQYAAMCDAMARETPEQKMRFGLELAAHLGNQSAADRLRELPISHPPATSPYPHQE